MLSRRARNRLVAILAGSIGCQSSLPELELEGKRVAVGVHSDIELCAGTLRAWDDHIAFVETQLGIARDPNDMIDVYVVDDTKPWCDDVMACYIGGWVDATIVPAYEPRAIWHELVHHVASGSDLGMTDRFLSEGMAGSLGDSWCPTPGTQWPQPALPTLWARNDVAYEHYPRATQFVDYVRDVHDPAALVELVTCIDRGDSRAMVDRCFEKVLGGNLEEIDEYFSTNPPALHGNPALCRGEAIPWHGTTWHFEATLACEDPAVLNTFRSRHGRQTSALIDIAYPGQYNLQVRTDGDATIELEPCFCATEDATLQHRPESGSIWVGEPGRYRFIFDTADPTTAQLQVDLWPTNGRRRMAPA